MQVYAPPRATVQQVLLRHDAHTSSNAHVDKVLQRLRTCRTSALGYHVYRCSDESFSHIKYQYHSCRDRHCPQCGALKKQEWIEARTAELLPVKYYHVVFTLPHELNSLVMGHRKLLYKLLFEASSRTLLTFAADPKYLAGGGITSDSTWKEAIKNEWDFLFPVAAMSQVYRGKFLEALKEFNGTVVPTSGTDIRALFNLLYHKDWIVYAKAPFGGPQAVIEYLGRYTHKVAISNHRITSINELDGTVNFEYKDYSDDNKQNRCP